MKRERPTKAELVSIIKLNEDILNLLPSGDVMHLMYKKMSDRLQERYDTYDQFLVNPYWTSGSQCKFNSDTSLDLGEYTEGKNKH